MPLQSPYGKWHGVEMSAEYPYESSGVHVAIAAATNKSIGHLALHEGKVRTYG
jgi:hypothetical protein